MPPPAEVDARLFELLVERAESAPLAAALENVSGVGAVAGRPYVDLGDSPTLSAHPATGRAALRAFELRIGALLELGGPRLRPPRPHPGRGAAAARSPTGGT